MKQPEFDQKFPTHLILYQFYFTAPTGTAAFNIQGMTVHAAFAINKNATLPYQPLEENLLNKNRPHFEIDTENLEKALQDVKEGKVQETSWASSAPEIEIDRIESEMEKTVEVPENPKIYPNSDSKNKHQKTFFSLRITQISSERNSTRLTQNEQYPAGPVLLHQTLNNLGYVKWRKENKAAVIKYQTFSSEKNPEDYYLSLLQLFLPHRESMTLPSENRPHFEIDTENLEKALQDVKEGKVQETSWASSAPEIEIDRIESEMEKTVEVPEDPKIYPNSDSKNKHQKTFFSLRITQISSERNSTRLTQNEQYPAGPVLLHQTLVFKITLE
ncbi:unnamed protein product [Mytilus edulis]|uniref:Uncharacterized protein n=1 Tax=Mytilus edulis TaxID=6550 RepID=A0A8S3RQ72_MYTED|nr:unnamed protein product [Mytilus edulis]